MKPLYVFLLMWAIFITGLSDGIAAALGAIPAIGIILAFVIAFCINITMGAGLLFLLAFNDMYHPRIGPFTIIGGLIPGLNFLPFWVGLVVAGIFWKMNEEGGATGALASTALNLQTIYQGGGNPLQKMNAARGIVRNLQGGANNSAAESGASEETKARTPSDLKSPSLMPRMGSDVAPPRKPHYAQTA